MKLSRYPASELAIIGAYPPPQGGVANHVSRLCNILDARGAAYRVYNAVSASEDGQRVVSVYSRRVSWMIKYLWSCRETSVYILSDRLAVWAVGALLAILRRKRVTVRLRNSALIDWIARSRLRRVVGGWLLRQVSGVVAVSERLADAARSVGVPDSQILVAPGFLPPRPEEYRREAVASEVWEFVRVHGPILVTSGKIAYHDGCDLYGLDQLVEAMARLRPSFPKLGLVVCFWDHLPGDEHALGALRTKARELRVDDAVLFNTKSGPLLPVLAVSDAFIRATNTDGDANSIREALGAGIPAIASDVVDRPSGTILFKTRDLEDMVAGIRRGLEMGADGARRREFVSPDADYCARYIDFILDIATKP